MHIEQPASRHSNPASRKMRSRPSSSAWYLTWPEPGTTSAVTPSATLRPLAIAAAAGQDERGAAAGDLGALGDRGGGAKTLDRVVGARADKNALHRDIGQQG